ncbi:Tn3 family transposase [Rhizobium sp. RU36D]|uniref:Tn3 family transposase n=1 Tax=Rhizobium sp. RU36D TaxID=1907415 RepID=UPI0009D79BED|nr:Tn3 family transposase [Rhizobium sp. RU36D]SMD12266.1 Transposase and inactivated derivatives, TnpA family [Rhizobium sp. RU36D]
MPVGFLTESQAREYGRFTGEPTPDQLARYFHLDDADRGFVSTHRSDHNRLGVAVQLGSLRMLGVFLENPGQVPATALQFIARQLSFSDPERLIAEYVRSEGRWRHAPRIRVHYGYRTYTDPGVGFRLNRFLYALCWTGSDRGSVLFDRAVAWLLEFKVLLPGSSVLERTVARVRTRANARLHKLMVVTMTSEQRARLDELVVIPEGERQSPLDRLRDGPYIQSSREITRALNRLGKIRSLTEGMPFIDRLPPGRITALARFASAAKAQAVSRLPPDRRAATLLAFIRTLEASASDDVIDLFDAVSTSMFSEASTAAKQARLRSLRDLDAAALKLREAAIIILDPDTPDDAVRNAVFQLVDTDALAAAVERVGELAEPHDETYFSELRKFNRKIAYTPALLTGLDLGAAPAGRPLLEAIEYLRAIHSGRKRTGPPPTTFAPKQWLRQIRSPDGSLDLTGYRLCVLDCLRRAIRRRDLFPARSLRYADPRKGLLSGPAWEAARPTVCRTVGVSSVAEEELGRLSQRLDLAFRETASRVPANSGGTIVSTPDGPDIYVERLEKLEEPASLVALRMSVEARLPRLDLPELIMEMHARTGFADLFTHASEGGTRAGDVATSICAVLVAEATNTGFEPLVRLDSPALRRSRLSWVKQNFLRAETLTAANAALVAAQNSIPLARQWGGGEVASADGLRFVVPIRTIYSGPNPKYFGQERGVTWYNLASDQFTGLNAMTVPGTLRDSLNLLAIVLEQETELQPTEIMTDTAGYTDTIFGIFHLLGYQFSPRIADVGGARFWRVDAKADYGILDAIASNKINIKLIAEHWDDLLRLAGSLKLGVVHAAGLTRTLQTNDRPTRLARALQELGRLIKTLYLLRFIDDETYRRRILVQLNRGEGRHQLARIIFHGKRGELRQRYREGQEDQLGALGLVVNLVVLWNTIYMDAAIKQLVNERYDVRPEDLARLSPLGFGHVNMLGRYTFTLPEFVARGQLRPLRDPKNTDPDEP